MPLARFQLRNEYGLGAKELYREPSEIEDPKLVLDGVAVAGLVGLLRQLGDLAEFAAEVFHGLQDELTTTASKSRKLITRVKRVEAALPPIEKAILSQTSHIHFAYAPGSDWHARIRNEQNHFIYTYLPRCIMDPYEECREPPRLQLLDKFDAGGPGSCLKRYSDPTFFRKLSANSDINDEKYHKGRKSKKSKRRRAKKRSSQLPFSAPNFDSSDRPKVSLSSKPQQSSPVNTSSTYDMTVKSDLVVQPGSLRSGDGMGFIECVFHPCTSQPDQTKIVLPLSDNRMMSSPDSNNADERTSDIHDDVQESSILEKNTHHTSSVTWVSRLDNRVMSSPDSNYVDEQTPVIHVDVQESSTMEKNTSSVTWDEKVEIVDPMVLFSGLQDDPEFDKQEIVPSVWKSLDDPYFDYDEPDIEPMKLTFGSYEATDVHSTGFQLNLENGTNYHTYEGNEISGVCEIFEPDDLESIPSGQISRDNGISQVYKTSPGYDLQEMDPVVGEIVDFAGKNQPDDIESETDNFVDALNAIESDSEKDLDCQTRREVVPYTHDQPLELESPSSPYQDFNQTTCEESFHLSPASFDTSEKEVCVHADDLVSPLELADNATFQTIPLSSIQHVSCGTDFGTRVGITDSLQEQSHLSIPDSVQQPSDLGFPDDITDSLQPQSDVGESLSETKETGSIAESDKVTICTTVSEQAPVEYCNVNSVALWTNGGLLGLQPSKPPDFKTCPSYQSLMPKDDNLQGKLDLSNRQIDCEEKIAYSHEPSLDSNANEIGVTKELPQFPNSGLVESPIESNQINFMPSVTHLETKDSSASEARIRTNGTFYANDDGGLLANGLQRTRSTEHDEKPETPKTDMKEPVNSPPPSPPLEHMKISFQPLNTFETFKLKIKYPEGIDHHDENVNVYPSFQLIPKPNHLHRTTTASDSDDDTFCRSNPCMSDDDLSYLSDSVWGSGDSLEDDRPYDGLERISYDELVLCSGEHEKMPTKRMHNNAFESSELEYEIGLSRASSGPISDIPVLNVMNSTSYQENKFISEAPLLPPVQWNTVVAGSESTPFNDLSSFSLCKNSRSSFSQIPNLEPDRLHHSRNEQLNQVKLNSNTLEQINQASGRSVDENEEFLQQIRTTSFNLRKTGLLTPTCTSTPSTNVNVTAILQKASAIRKVVASDGEDIEPWSDT